jgi:hypothetical protein
MAIDLDIADASFPTKVSLYFSSFGASGTIELQIATRPDFRFCVAPVLTLTRTSPQQITGLNQRCTYYFRARTRLADGSAEPWSNVASTRTVNGAPQVYPSGGILIEPTMIVVPQHVVKFRPFLSAVAGFPVSNLVIDSPVAFRQVGTFVSPYWYYQISWEVGPNVSLDTIALLNTNLPEDALISIAQTGNPDFVSDLTNVVVNAPFRASPNLPGRHGYHGLTRFTPTVGRYWIVNIQSSGPLLHAEHLVCGLSRVSKNHALDKTESANPQTTIERKRTGLVDRQYGLPMRKVEFDLSALTETQYETLYGDLIYRANEPVLVVPNSKNGAFLHDRILYGDLSGGRVVNTSSPFFTRSFAVDSII